MFANVRSATASYAMTLKSVSHLAISSANVEIPQVFLALCRVRFAIRKHTFKFNICLTPIFWKSNKTPNLTEFYVSK